MGDAIKRLFHRRHWSTDKDFKLSHVQSRSYRDAVSGTPPRRGSLPLRGDLSLTADRALETFAHSGSPTRIKRPASVGPSQQGRAQRNRLRKAVSDASRKGRPETLWKTENGDVRNSEEMPPPPLPGTAVTSDDARHGSGAGDSLAARQLSAGSESYYGDDVADRTLSESFPRPPAISARKRSAADRAKENAARKRSSYPAPLSVPSKGLNPRDTANYSLEDEAAPSSDQLRIDNTQSRLFLDNSSDEESADETPKRNSRGSLRRKRAYSSGLRDLSDPTHQWSVQEPMERFYTPDGIPDGYSERSAQRSYLIEDGPEPPSLEGIVDLTNTEDTTYHSRYAPAVTHETIQPEVHEIREERIFREVHTHEVFHRILPVIDVEVLPARHFVRNNEGGLTAIPEEQIPGRSTNNQTRNWVVAETVSRRARADATAEEPRKFTARGFSGTEGDEVRYTTEEGFERTETTWVHPPTIEKGARDSGQTEPLYVRSLSAGEHEDEPSPPMSLRDLSGGIRDAPFDECAEVEAANAKMKTLHIKSDSGVGRM